MAESTAPPLPTQTNIMGHFCGQMQPHAAHTWQTPQVYGTASFSGHYQCAGFSGYQPTPPPTHDRAVARGSEA